MQVGETWAFSNHGQIVEREILLQRKSGEFLTVGAKGWALGGNMFLGETPKIEPRHNDLYGWWVPPQGNEFIPLYPIQKKKIILKPRD